MDSRVSLNKNSVRSTLKDLPEWGKPTVQTVSPFLPALHVEYVQAEDLSRISNSGTSHVLATIGYGSEKSPTIMGKSLSVEVNLPPLTNGSIVEVWKSPFPVLCDQVQDLRLAFNNEAVFGCLEVKEPTGSGLEDVARAAYERIFEYCTGAGFLHLLRMWNYFPDINAHQNGLERYKRFCIGRHQAFSAQYQEFRPLLPAASAVGTSGGPFQVFFLAGVQPGIPVENPRQISAYAYPQIYGPKSPSFARATVHRTNSGSQLFVAGTASIVGHATQHHGDSTKQTLETLSNIDAILNRVRSEILEFGHVESSEGFLKVFVRNRADLPKIREALNCYELAKQPIFYVLGEMCRKELLVEIEGIWNLPMKPNDS